MDHDGLVRLIGPVVGSAGMDLESVRAGSVGRRLLLRVVVDADGGVALDDIACLSRDLSTVLDADAILADVPYTLEVSSPGVDRPLTEPRHWRRAAGRLVRVGLTAGGVSPGVPGVIEARVVTATDDAVTLDIDGSRSTVGYADLGPGRVQVEFGHFAEGPGADGGEPDGH